MTAEKVRFARHLCFIKSFFSIGAVAQRLRFRFFLSKFAGKQYFFSFLCVLLERSACEGGPLLYGRRFLITIYKTICTGGGAGVALPSFFRNFAGKKIHTDIVRVY